jgi:hypothetical protein
MVKTVSTNKTDRHDITEILLKVALNIINPIKSFKYSLQLNKYGMYWKQDLILNRLTNLTDVFFS